jgi:hypothetical protein
VTAVSLYFSKVQGTGKGKGKENLSRVYEQSEEKK